MTAAFALWGIAALLAISVVGVILGRRPAGTPIVYGACAAVCASVRVSVFVWVFPIAHTITRAYPRPAAR